MALPSALLGALAKALAFAAVLVAACGPREPSFVCLKGRATCPAEECPAIPLGAGGCETLPGLFGNPATPVQVGRPEGCVVTLPYGNPYYGDEPQTCSCENNPDPRGPATLGWSSRSLAACAPVTPYASDVHVKFLFAGAELEDVCPKSSCAFAVKDAPLAM